MSIYENGKVNEDRFKEYADKFKELNLADDDEDDRDDWHQCNTCAYRSDLDGWCERGPNPKPPIPGGCIHYIQG